MNFYMHSAILSVAFRMLLLLPCSDGCGRSSCPRPSPDNTKPTIKCPNDIHKLADDKQIFSTAVDWTEPQANDNRDGSITPTRTGYGPGNVFYEGTEGILYTAKDRSGNFRTCNFKVHIAVHRCPSWGRQSNGWRSCSPSHDMLRGTECRFGCYPGFELVGSSTVTCIDENTWSEKKQPYCRPKTCERLLEEDDKTNITCTDGNNYRSICYYTCTEGYDILPGINRARVCSADRTWTGQVPKCRDASPPVFTDCPAIKIGYAESSKTSGRIAWDVPRFADNDGNGGVTLRQIVGPKSGAELAVGEYNVHYEASDRENNTAACEFKVVLKQISCNALYPKPYTYVTCPLGNRFGSSCTFSCKNGTALNRPASVQCESYTHGNVRFGRWSFGETQPVCNLVSSCDKPVPPNNGALVCDTWAGGKYCQIQCRQGYLIDRDTESLLLCKDSKGTWDTLQEDENLPDCNKATYLELVVLNLQLEEYFYYDGDCTNSSDEIRQNFLDAIFGEIGDICSKSSCTIDDTEVLCGNVTDRKKRAVRSNLIIKSNIKLSRNNSDALSMMNTRIKVLKKLQDDVGHFTIATSSGNAILQSAEMSQLLPECQPGSYGDKYSLACVECMPGSYHDTATDTCTKCPRGQYQPEHGRTNCIQCSDGKTTERIGAVEVWECTAACPPGFSSSNGVPPCSPCNMGTYSSVYGAVECTACPGSRTTNTFDITESTSAEECFDFDINFPGTHEQEASVLTQLEDDVTSFELGLWIQCKACNTVVKVTDGTGNFSLDISHDSRLSINLNGCEVSTDVILNVGTTRWRHILVSVDATGIYLEVDGAVFSDSLSCAYHAISLADTINVTVGGDGFLGRVSQLNIWTGSTDTNSFTSGCYGEQTGNILSWRQFQDVEGAFTISPSECDAYDNCLSNPCNSQGRCIDQMDTFSCICDDGFEGDTCQDNINDCYDNSCENGATCQDGAAGYTCDCKQGYSGLFCETKVVDGAWAQWGSWGPCSVTCGKGTHARRRVCADPSPDNGGKYCDGDADETSDCNMPDKCHDECKDDPTTLEHGTMNCSWTDSTQTERFCYPTCNKGYAFDSDLFLWEIVCGPKTGYIWNIRNDQNPEAQIPACTEIVIADANVLKYSAEYQNLTSQKAAASASDVTETVQNTATDGVSGIECVKNGSCELERIDVTNVDEDSARRRRELSVVGFVVEISCSPNTSVSDCYNLLLDVKNQLDAIVNSTSALSVRVDQVVYNIVYNSTAASGRSYCKPGTVPVDYFCIHCGPGSYQIDIYCERCPKGTYQDTPGAVGECKQCPDGWTTTGLQTRNITGCNVKLPDESNSDFVKILVVVIISAIVVFMASGVVGYQRFKSGYVKRQTKVDVMPGFNEKYFNNRNTKFAWHDYQPYTFGSISPFEKTHTEVFEKPTCGGHQGVS